MQVITRLNNNLYQVLAGCDISIDFGGACCWRSTLIPQMSSTDRV
ncbi:hypothetical protein [Chamaesiphon sp. OTE_75_metabat_556]|nr:hypothetical protein [Chamaesiphon sp. OTE_75_metabat_556]